MQFPPRFICVLVRNNLRRGCSAVGLHFLSPSGSVLPCGLCQLGFAPAEVLVAGGGVGAGQHQVWWRSASLRAVGVPNTLVLKPSVAGGLHSWCLLWFLGETEAFVLHWSLLHPAGRPCRGGGMQYSICSRDHPDQPM